jgi:predicted deacylase
VASSHPRRFTAARVLADGVLNVLKYYQLITGEPTSAGRWLTGVQHALLAPASGLFLAETSLEFQKPMQQGDLIARIVDVYGDQLAEIRAPVDGLIFGLRALPNVQTGDWCCFYAEIQGS